MEANSTNNSATTAQEEKINNTIIAYWGEVIDADDAVELSAEYYSDKIDSGEWDSLWADSSDTTEVSIGQYQGCIILEEDAVQVLNGKTATIQCQENGDVLTTYCGDTFHSDQQDIYDIVWTADSEYAYRSDCSYAWTGRNMSDWLIDSYNDEMITAEDGEIFMNQRVAEMHGYHYSENIGNWTNEEEEDDENYVRDYHHYTRRRRYDNDNDVPKFCFGMEVEKEDAEVRNIGYADDIYNSIEWCKERDASLNDSSGFEAVSPVYDLFGNKWKEDLKNNDLQQILNAKYSDACGGHFNISSSEFSPSELAEGLSAFFPLLYALYPNRVNVDYCGAKKKNEMLYRSVKRSAIYVQGNRVEFRIFPAVRNVDNYKWRINLMKIMVANINKSEVEILMMLLNKRSALRKHIELVIPIDKMDAKVMQYVAFSKLYNDKNIDNNFNSAKK